MKKILIVGAGFAGAVIARELASTGQYIITLIDQRNHIGGNTYDPVCPSTGVRIHKYGPHIFHTNDTAIVEYLSQFTQWTKYQHKVEALINDHTSVPLPININTLNTLYQLKLSSPEQMKTFLASLAVIFDKQCNAEEYALSVYGKELTDMFFSRYTEKMWDLKLSELPISVLSRLPIRYDDNPYYFNDSFQAMPTHGYETLFKNLLNHKNIILKLNTSFNKSDEAQYEHIFNSMPIDSYYDEQFGALPYRSIQFDHEIRETWPHAVPTVNFTDTSEWTRMTNWSLYPDQNTKNGILITKERPCSYEDNNFERYYPVKTVDGAPQEIYRQYRELSKQNSKTTFIGRCGQYIYYDMHQVVANSLKIAKDFSLSTAQ